MSHPARLALAALLTAAVVGPRPAQAADDWAIFRALDAVGPLDGHRYDPRPVIDAVNLLQPLGKARGVEVLRRYIARRGQSLHPGVPDALFVVIRTLFDPPGARRGPGAPTPPPDACTPRQRAFVSDGCLRPPRLGGPQPPPPEDLRSLRYPAFVLGDVPLSLVSGYMLGGKAEPLGMHLDALVAEAQWRPAPLRPKSADEIRYLFMHYGQWAWTDAVGKMVESQLRRMEGPPLACFDLGLWCVPRTGPDTATLRRLLGDSVAPATTELTHRNQRLLVAFLELPTDSESYIYAAAWAYTAHFAEWRLFLLTEIYGAVSLSAAIDASAGTLVLTGPDGSAAHTVSLPSIPYRTTK